MTIDQMPRYNTIDELVSAYMHNEIVSYAPNREHAKRFLAESQTPLFCMAAPEVMDLPDQDTFLWRYLFEALRIYHNDPAYKWRPQFQHYGTCVGQGTKTGQDVVAAVNYILYRQPFPGRFAVAGTYPGSRVEIGRQPGTWQGSSGSWAAEWCVKGGGLPLKALDLPDDCREADENLAMKWTASREGIPTEFENIARQYPIVDAPAITTAREAGKAIQNGNFIIHGSNLIPTGKRDNFGFSHVQKAGGHLTGFGGVRYNPFGLLYWNSWDVWGSGPKWPDDQPDGTVWLDEDEANAIIAQRDSFSLCGSRGLVPFK